MALHTKKIGILPSKVTINLHDIKTKDISLTNHKKLPDNILNMLKGMK